MEFAIINRIDLSNTNYVRHLQFVQHFLLSPHLPNLHSSWGEKEKQAQTHLVSSTGAFPKLCGPLTWTNFGSFSDSEEAGREKSRKERKSRKDEKVRDEWGRQKEEKMEERGENGDGQRGHERRRTGRCVCACVWRRCRHNYHFFHRSFTTVLCRHAQQAGTALGPSPLMKYYHSGGRIRAFQRLSQSLHSHRLRGEQDVLPNKV